MPNMLRYLFGLSLVAVVGATRPSIYDGINEFANAENMEIVFAAMEGIEVRLMAACKGDRRLQKELEMQATQGYIEALIAMIENIRVMSTGPEIQNFLEWLDREQARQKEIISQISEKDTDRCHAFEEETWAGYDRARDVIHNKTNDYCVCFCVFFWLIVLLVLATCTILYLICAKINRRNKKEADLEAADEEDVEGEEG